MIDREQLKKKVTEYKQNFDLGWWRDEKYKWEAVKMFQDNWDIAAKDFAGMLTRSLSATKNLLAASHYFPQRMIIELSQAAPDEVREMYRALFNEEEDVAERITAFTSQADMLLANYRDGRDNHFQNNTAVATYLWLRYPDKYYIYKYKEVKKVAEVLKYDHLFHKGEAGNIKHFYALYDEVHDYIEDDSELIALFTSHLTDSCYPDPQHRTLSADICYHIAHSPADEDSPILFPQGERQDGDHTEEGSSTHTEGEGGQ